MTIAKNPSQPSRPSAKPLRTKTGVRIAPATAKRTAAMSHGVRLVLTPHRATTIHPAQMLTAAMPASAPCTYRDADPDVSTMAVRIADIAPRRWQLSDAYVYGRIARGIMPGDVVSHR